MQCERQPGKSQTGFFLTFINHTQKNRRKETFRLQGSKRLQNSTRLTKGQKTKVTVSNKKQFGFVTAPREPLLKYKICDLITNSEVMLYFLLYFLAQDSVCMLLSAFSTLSKQTNKHTEALSGMKCVQILVYTSGR